MAKVQIVPHLEANGTDFCGQESYQFVIRSDLGYYMKTYHVRDDNDLSVHPLHPACTGGDHYVGTTSYFFVIKGNSCRRVTDLSTDAEAVKFTLHPECTGGSFYFANDTKNMYVIYKDGTLKHMRYMSREGCEIRSRSRLHSNCQGGLYYWATEGWFYLLKRVDQWGLEYRRTRDLATDRESTDFSVHPTVAKFLPGGLAVTLGPTVGEWELLKAIKNDSADIPLKWNHAITKKVGYKKEVMQSLQHNWNITTSYSTEISGSLEVEKLFTSSVKTQFSLSASYGGHQLNTNSEDWSEEHTIEQKLDLTVPPRKCLYVWQYKVGMKKQGEHSQDVLYCQQLQMTDTPAQPPQPIFSRH